VLTRWAKLFRTSGAGGEVRGGFRVQSFQPTRLGFQDDSRPPRGGKHKAIPTRSQKPKRADLKIGHYEEEMNLVYRLYTD
jgi:hypothetical protein